MERVLHAENITSWSMETVFLQVRILSADYGIRTKLSVTAVTTEIFSTWTIMEYVHERTKTACKSIHKLVNVHLVEKDIRLKMDSANIINENIKR